MSAYFISKVQLNTSQQIQATYMSPYFTFYSFNRRFYPKQLTNEDNRINQNQQMSNNMQVQWQVLVSLG